MRMFPIFLVLFCAGSYASFISLNPTDDVEVWTAHPDRNFNQVGDYTDQSLIAGYSYIGPHYENSLLKFDLSSLPDDAEITSAVLNLYGRGTSDERVFVYTTTEDGWDEGTVTWNSYAAYMSGSLVADTDVVVGYDQDRWFQWNIDLSNWNWAGDLGDNAVTLVLKGDTSDYNYSVSAILSSKEYRDFGGNAYVPYLDITYIPEPAALSLFLLGGLSVARCRKR